MIGDSEYLARLLDRAATPSLTVRPRPRSRHETYRPSEPRAAGAYGRLSEVHDDGILTVVEGGERVDGVDSAPGTAEPASLRAPSSPSGARNETELTSAGRSASEVVTATRRRPSVVQDGRPGRIDAVTIEALPPGSGPHAPSGGMDRPPERVVAPALVAPTGGERGRRPADQAVTPTSRAELFEDDAAERSLPRRPGHRRDGRVTTEPTATTVNVTIGRIEVRAVPRSAPSLAARQTPAVLPLEEYLRQRGRGVRP